MWGLGQALAENPFDECLLLRGLTLKGLSLDSLALAPRLVAIKAEAGQSLLGSFLV